MLPWACPLRAREVPPWLIAGPVLRRIEGLLAHRRRGFVERERVVRQQTECDRFWEVVDIERAP